MITKENRAAILHEITKALQPLADHWEPLPAGTFAEQGTNVNTVLLTIHAATAPAAITAEEAPAAVTLPENPNVTLCLF